jgi:hypothetical protein
MSARRLIIRSDFITAASASFLANPIRSAPANRLQWMV